MRTLILLLLMPLLAGATCQRRDDPPETVSVVVEKYRDLPEWATRPLPKPVPADGTVGARTQSHDDRGGVIDVANCHRALLRKLDAEQPVSERDCAVTQPAEPAQE